MNILITGANGFVGRSLSKALLRANHTVFGVTSRAGECLPGVKEWLCARRDFVDLAHVWQRDIPIDCVVHLASRVHKRDENRQQGAALLAQYRETNVNGSVRVAQAAQAAGVRRLVFLSSIKALGDTEPGTSAHPWREDDVPHPCDPYGISKREAEDALLEFSRNNLIEVVGLRPPLVYGPEVRANFLQLMRATASGWPMPLGGVTAKRSIIFVENLGDAIALCCHHPAASGHIFHVSDGQDMTVGEMIRVLERGLGKRARLLDVPLDWLTLAGRLSGRADQIQKLTSPLRLDIHLIRRTLHWTPPHSVERGLMETAAWFQLQRRGQ
ncbi:NAD-dependent epimerase/dehydratase family protein [Robbsia sp. Bb-Pol-6]|uniref:NAD-dependent epimerase/dehydratase family protein n=1 Tax=Robbsia betulipollinis TaxID=2981849 RepID=A0ABT3ZLZ8_9BURK|nr:NAD-dependent epimerase/dehydratase family protein [Robbsia betulipollinis]MCY0387568.1 NAD-dependent epimerase/dehydratase family protein [Robbsia betulipollinis]